MGDRKSGCSPPGVRRFLSISGDMRKLGDCIPRRGVRELAMDDMNPGDCMLDCCRVDGGVLGVLWWFPLRDSSIIQLWPTPIHPLQCGLPKETGPGIHQTMNKYNQTTFSILHSNKGFDSSKPKTCHAWPNVLFFICLGKVSNHQ